MIGILAQPYPGDMFAGQNYIMADYARWLEAAGARVVGLNYTDPYHYRWLLPQLNGVLLPGGGTKLYDSILMNYTQYLWVEKEIIDYAKQANDKG